MRASAWALGVLAAAHGCSSGSSPGGSSGGAAGTSGTGGAAQGGSSGTGGAVPNDGAAGGSPGSGGSAGMGGSAGSGGSAGMGGSGGSGGSGDSGGGAGAIGGAGGNGGAPELPPVLGFTHEGPSGTIEAIWGSGSADIYAVGRTGTLLHSTGDGTWQTQNPGTSANLTGIWGSGASDVYVSVDSNVILHSAGGGTWEHQTYDSGFTFNNIFGIGTTDVYVVGPGVVHRSSATGTWERPPQQVTSGGPTLALWGTSPSNLYAATSNANNSVVFHSTGDGIWRAQTTPAASAALDISGADASHLYAAADGFVFFSTGNGTWMTQLTVPGDAVRALWVAAPNAVYACTELGKLFRSNGAGTWSDAQDIDPSTTFDSCYAIWGTGTDNVYVGGAGGIHHGKP